MSLGCPYYFFLLLMKKIIVNITDFPASFKIYKKNFHRTPMLKFQAEITDMLVFGGN